MTSDLLYVVFASVLIILVVIAFCIYKNTRYDDRGFRNNGIHKNGTRYDENGYDCAGYDKNGYNSDGYNKYGFDIYGYNRYGFDKEGYDKKVYDHEGYNKSGKNSKGLYSRYHDRYSYLYDSISPDGFLDPKLYPVGMTTHACERMKERLGITYSRDMLEKCEEAYDRGKSARQMMKSEAQRLIEISERHESGIPLLYRNFVYIFSEDNSLITLYKYNNYYH